MDSAVFFTFLTGAMWACAREEYFFGILIEEFFPVEISDKIRFLIEFFGSSMLMVVFAF